MEPMGGVASTSNAAIRKLGGVELAGAGDSTAVTRALTNNGTHATTTKSRNTEIVKLGLLQKASAEVLIIQYHLLASLIPKSSRGVGTALWAFQMIFAIKW